QASVVKINPDAPQSPVRFLSLETGKTVVLPTPRLRKGFILLDPDDIPPSKIKYSSTIRGAFTYGRLISPENLPRIDLVVAGSVAVDRCGRRLGKGEGYSEIEWGILSEFGKVNSETPIVTTVHDLQIVPEIPSDPWDFTVDIIVTPTRILLNTCERRKPKGIMWEFLTKKKLREIPLLQELKKRAKRK
ncbi:MAG: 5-formyltetrahydrofolate cyclo-ligase, partial [Thermoprotei archaeon]